MMFFMFWSTFTLGAYPQEWIEGGFSWLGGTVGRFMTDGPLRDLIVDGIIGGLGIDQCLCRIVKRKACAD